MTTLSNISLVAGEYLVSNSNPTGILTIKQPTTQNYLFSYGVNIATNRIHNYITTIGDLTSNITVALNGSNLSISNATSNLFNNFIPSAYLTTGYNSLYINRIEGKLMVGINGSNLVRISNSNVLPQTYNNSTVTITASNNTKFNNISLLPTAVTNVPMDFLQPIKGTSIACSNVSSCNIDVLTSNLSATSNTSYWSSNNLVKKSGDTMTGYLSVSMCNGNVVLGSTSNAGAFISLNQGLSMFNSASNYPYYGIGINSGGKMNIQSYYGVSLGDKNTTAITIQNGNVGIGVSNPSVMLDVAGAINAPTITSLSNLGLYGSNTSLWSSNASVALSNNVTSFSNSFIGLSNNFSTLSNSFTSFSNSQISFSTSTNSSISFLSNAQLTTTSNFNTLSNYTYFNVSSLSNAGLITTSNITSLCNYTYSNINSLSNAGLTITSNLSSLSNYTYGFTSNNSNMIYWNSNTTVSLSNNVSAIASSLSNTSNLLVSYSNWESGRLDSLSNFAYNINTSNSTVTNVYTSNIYSSSGGTIGSLVMSGAGLALGGYNLLNNSGFLTSALKDATGLKVNIDPSAGSMSALSLLGKFGQYTDSVMVGVSTLELSNNQIYFKNGTTSNTIYSSNAITVLNSALTNFTISNANIVTNCNLVSPTITTLSNIAYYASNNLLSKSNGTMVGSLYVSACNGGVYLGVTSNQGGFVSVNQGATMMTSDSNFPAYGIGCSSTGKVNIQGYYGLSFGDNVNTAMTIVGNAVGIGLSNPASKLDVVGNVNASSFSGATISALSNLGLFGSNTSVFGSNAVISLSNQVFGSTTTNISTAQVTANFGSNYSVFSSNASVYGSNTAVFGSNSVISLSNQVFGSTTTNISTAQATANFSSNTGVSASNTSVWSSNNLLNKAGGTISNFLAMTSNGGNALLGSSGSNGSYLSLLQGANLLNPSSNFVYYGIGCSGNGAVNIQGYGGVSLGDNAFTTLYIKATNVGIGVSNPSYKLDVSGTVNSTGNITSPTITSLSNLGMYNSNTSGYSSNTAVSLSNYIYTTSTTNITAVQSTATFGSNTSVFGSNATVTLSNFTYGTNTTNITNAQSTASFGSNTSVSLSNFTYGTNTTNITNAQTTASFGSNASVFGSNTSVWSSNNLLKKGGDTMTGSLILQYGSIIYNGSAYYAKSSTGINVPLVTIDSGNNVRYYGGSNSSTMYINPDTNCTTEMNYNNSNNTTIWYGTSPVLTQSLGNIGIGTASPSFKLDVSGSMRATNYILPNGVWIQSADGKNRLNYGTNTRSYYGSYDGYEWRSSTDAHLATLTNAGDLGIGTNTPSAKLEVVGGIATQRINVGGGTTYSKLQSIVLNPITSSVRKLDYTMDGTFPSSYDLFVQPVSNSTTINDTFATTVMVQSSTQIRIIICRVDESAGWTNPVTLHLLLMSKD